MIRNCLAKGLMILIGIFHCGNARAEVSAIDFEKEGPVELLALLTERARQDASSANILIDDDVVGWISEQDIPALISKLRSTEVCLSIRKPESSFYPPRGTEGDMAAYLIESFRRRIFPYSLYSREVDDVEKDNLERWWSVYTSATRVRRELKLSGGRS